MTSACIEAIKEAYKCGRLNPYMVKRLLDAARAGMTKSLMEELITDAQEASDAGVNSDRDYSVYFFTGRLADDILDDTFGLKVEPDRKKELRHYIMSHKDDEDYALDNLTDYRLLIHKWLCDGMSKKAYPNIEGKNDTGPQYRVDKWIGTLKKIYAILHSKKADRSEAISLCTDRWDPDERQSFINWMRYYEDGTTEKYNVKTAKFIKQAFEPEVPLPQAWVNDREGGNMSLSTRKEKKEITRREQELDKAKVFKAKMRARLRSFKRLLEKYNDILPKQDLESVYDELYGLEKSVSRLDVYASIQDCVIRSANRLEAFGFSEGADFLNKCAAEPVAGEDVVGALPAPEPKAPDAPPQGTQMVGLQSVINRLEGTSKALKSRDMIRELASIDILLNELGLASYFPELSFAQSKLIEAFGYASNKVEDIVAKLRGSGASKPTPAAPAPAAPPAPAMPKQPAPPPAPKPVDTGALLEKPVTEVKEKLPTG